MFDHDLHVTELVARVNLEPDCPAGVLAVGDVHGGAIEDGARILQEWVSRSKDKGLSERETARALLNHLRDLGKRMPGFGHRIHSQDPRTNRLFALARDLGFEREHVKLSTAIEQEFATRKALPINVDGAIAAIISDMGFDWRLGKAFFLIGRVAGMIAHVYEEMTTQKPMRRMCGQETEYDGPWERSFQE